MKPLLESWKKFLNEAITDVVYHVTNIESLKSILTSNKFMTSVAKGIDSDEKINKKKMYFFSLARSKTSKFLLGETSHYISAILVIDGRKLSQKYKGGPVNYWGNWEDTDETEDRVFTDKPYIENAIQYIAEVHILLKIYDKYFNIHESDLDIIDFIDKRLQENNKPVYYYTNSRAIRLLNKKESLDLKTLKDEIRKTGRDIEKPIDWGYNPTDYDGNDFKQLIELIKAVEVENVEKLNWNNRWYRYIGSYHRDFSSQLQSLIHNNRKKETSRKYIEDILYYMKKRKLQTFEDLRAYLDNRIREIKDNKTSS